MKVHDFRRIFAQIALWGIAVVLIFGIRNTAIAAGLDRNRNGLNDVWELLFQGSALPPGADSDGDGFSNASESGAGTDPSDPSSFPSIRLGNSALSWLSVPGKRYSIFSASNLSPGTWTN